MKALKFLAMSVFLLGAVFMVSRPVEASPLGASGVGAMRAATLVPTATKVPTPTKIPTVVAFQSIAAQDGWVRETSENGSVGGSTNSTATTFNVGDDAARRQYLGILSFSTAGLPDAAQISLVTLKFKRSATVGGGIPLTMFQGFMVDIKNGSFGTAALQAGDFQALAGKTVGPFLPNSIDNWYSTNLTSSKAYINKLPTNGGLTQIRLRFKLGDNNDAVANYLSLFSGNALAADRPRLVISYYLP